MACQSEDCDGISLAELIDHFCAACEDEYRYCPRCVFKRDPRPSKKIEDTAVHIAETARIEHDR